MVGPWTHLLVSRTADALRPGTSLAGLDATHYETRDREGSSIRSLTGRHDRKRSPRPRVRLGNRDDVTTLG